MSRKILDETRELIQELYDGGLAVLKVSRRTGVPYSTVYGYTRARQRVNPETGQQFSSSTELRGYLARQWVNPETGQQFSSLTDYQEHLARQRQKKPINQEVSQLIKRRLGKLNKTQRWLSGRLGITEGTVSRYLSGKTTPRRGLQQRLFEELGLNYKTLDELLEDSELE
mgnify:CR=1 FL=1